MTNLWCEQDLDLVETLACRVRLLAIEQIARLWRRRQKSLRAVRRRLRRLAAAGLLARTLVSVHPLLIQSVPLIRWNLGEKAPDFSRVAMETRSRWRLPSVALEVCVATKLATNLFGSSARGLPPLLHRDHDLLLGQAYLAYRDSRADSSIRWLGEDSRPKAGYRVKDPDAFLVDDRGRISRVIESAGRYSAAQVEAFHVHCADLDLSYDLW